MEPHRPQRLRSPVSPRSPAARARGERGAVLVEAAFVLPVMLLFVAGIIDFGLAFKDLQTVFSATRVGARTASVETRQAGYADDVATAVTNSLNAVATGGYQELWVYKARSDGKPDSGNFTSCGTCIRYNWSTSTNTWTKTQDTWPATGSGSQYACSTSPGPDSLGVYVKVRHDMLTGFFGATKILTDYTVIDLEPRPSSNCQG
jgi:Flp pilus assembly protein TadG